MNDECICLLSLNHGGLMPWQICDTQQSSLFVCRQCMKRDTNQSSHNLWTHTWLFKPVTKSPSQQDFFWKWSLRLNILWRVDCTLCDNISRHKRYFLWRRWRCRHKRSWPFVTADHDIVTRYFMWRSFCDDARDGAVSSQGIFYDSSLTLHDSFALSYNPQIFVVIKCGLFVIVSLSSIMKKKSIANWTWKINS
jgi:hypothetical protein